MPKLSPPPFYAPPARWNEKAKTSEFAPEWLDYFTKQSDFLGNALNFASNDGGATLTYTNATTLTLVPAAGGRIPIYTQGQIALIELPPAGVTLANTGLSTSTLYYVYARYTGTMIVLEASTTGHANAGGLEVKSDDISRTLVGMAWTNGSSQFSDSKVSRAVATWFNKRPRAIGGSFGSDVNVSSTTPVAMTSPSIVFLSWGPSIASHFVANALCEWTAGSPELGYLEARIDGATVGTIGVATLTSTVTFQSTSCSSAEELSEGKKIFDLYGYTFGGNTVKYRGLYTGFSGVVIL